MRHSFFVTIIFLCSLIGCTKENSNPDYKFVITQLEKNDFYKQLIGHYIVQRRGENQYFYMSDPLVTPTFSLSSENQVVLDSVDLEDLHDKLQGKSIPDFEAYIKDLTITASIVIPFMRENGVYALDGQRHSKMIVLEILLENNYALFLVDKDFDKAKSSMSDSYEYIDQIDSWLIMKRKNL